MEHLTRPQAVSLGLHEWSVVITNCAAPYWWKFFSFCFPKHAAVVAAAAAVVAAVAAVAAAAADTAASWPAAGEELETVSTLSQTHTRAF